MPVLISNDNIDNADNVDLNRERKGVKPVRKALKIISVAVLSVLVAVSGANYAYSDDNENNRTTRSARRNSRSAPERAQTEPRQHNLSQQALIDDIIADRDFFAKFMHHHRSLHIDGRSILISINSGLICGEGKDLIGLLFLAPSGIMMTYVIDRDSVVVSQRQEYFVRKAIREDFANYGLPLEAIESVLRDIGVQPRPRTM